MESLEDANQAAELNKISRADFLTDVPTYLRYKVTENIFNGVATKVLIFENRDPDLVSHMVPKMVSLKVKRNEYVYKKGQFSSAIYLLFSGRVAEMDDQICFREYTIGSCFGQIEILLNLPRIHSVKATEDSHLMLIERTDITNAMKVFPELKVDLVISSIVKMMRTKQTLHKVGVAANQDLWVEGIDSR
jgi:CRP-like cAMP-binding protein